MKRANETFHVNCPGDRLKPINKCGNSLSGILSHVMNLRLTFQGEFGSAANAGRYHIVFAFFVSMMFAISLGSLFGYHCYLVANNRTTLGWYYYSCHACTSVTKLIYILLALTKNFIYKKYYISHLR